jgi:hypothetical protein
MKSPRLALAGAVLLGLAPVMAHAQNNQRIDDAECAAEAISMTGFDPATDAPPPAKASAPTAGSASPAQGPAQKSGKGASAQTQTVVQPPSSGQAAYNKAKAACMTARGYQAGRQP